jgi:UDPglucose--hexose-1-phosphate uridylyltransferase
LVEWFTPELPTRELASFKEYRGVKHFCLLRDYLQLELQLNERVVCKNDAFTVVVPFWAVWPFELLLLSKRHLASIDQRSGEERDLLGDTSTPFPAIEKIAPRAPGG